MRHQPLTYGHNHGSFVYKLVLVCSSTKCAKFLEPAVKVLSLITSVLVIFVGIAHLMNQLAEWCSNADPVDYACVGPWLFFNDDDFFKESKNCYSSLDHCESLYGSVFTLDPNTLACLWGPLFLGFWCVLPGGVSFLCLLFCPTQHLDVTFA